MDARSSKIIIPNSGHNDWLSARELADLTPTKLVERVATLQPLAAAYTEQAERQRRPVDEVMAAIRKSGVFYHFVPKKYGGLEYDLLTFVEVLLALSSGCFSTAWITGFCIQHNFFLAQFPQQAQDEIFGVFPYILAPGTAAPPGKAVQVPGGYRLNGRYKYASGVMHADWVFVAATVANEAGLEDVILFILPIKDVTVYDVWYMDGLAATGSNDIAINEAFVPAHRCVDFEEMRGGRGNGTKIYKNPLYRVSVDILLNISSATPAIGAARATVEDFRDRILQKAPVGADGKSIPKTSLLLRVAEAKLATDTAELLLRDSARRTQEAAFSGETLSDAERLNIRARITTAVHLSKDAVRIISDAAGTSAHNLSDPIQRAMRDLNMISSHAVYDKDNMLELLGKSITGTAGSDVFRHHSYQQVGTGTVGKNEQKNAGGDPKNKEASTGPII